MTVASLQTLPCLSPLITSDTITKNESLIFTRRALLFGTSFLAAPFSSSPSFLSAIALQPQPQDELEQQENRIVDLFQVPMPFRSFNSPTYFMLYSLSGCLQGASPSVVFIQDFELAKTPKNSSAQVMPVDETAKVEGTGSGFIWDKFGHIVRYIFFIACFALVIRMLFNINVLYLFKLCLLCMTGY